MTALNYDVLVEAADAAGLEERTIRTDYSGRGMYGRTCLGLVHRTINDLLRFHAALISQGVEMDRFSARQDAMGLGLITYWPSVTVEGVPE